MEDKNIDSIDDKEIIEVEETDKIEETNTSEEATATKTGEEKESTENSSEDEDFEYKSYGKEATEEARKTAEKVLGDIISTLKTKQNEFNKTVEGFKANKPPVDVFGTDEDLIIKIDLPRVTKDDISVKISTESVEIDVDFPDDLEEYDEVKILRKDRCSGLTKTIIPLPEEVDINEVSADFKNNVLTITLPKIKGRKVDVEIV